MDVPLLEGGSLEERLGYGFRDPSLLELALTHRSYANEKGLEEHYERLEFLGDAVLGLVAARWLYDTRPRQPEGELSRLKSSLVSARSLAAYARQLGLGAALRLGVGEERSGGRRKTSLLADSLEAVFGAVFQDGGLAAVEPVVVRFLAGQKMRAERDFKTALQESTQALSCALPEYRLLSETGPDHDKRFEVQCFVGGRLAGVGQGRTKKLAEQAAAQAALSFLDRPPGGP